MTLLDQDLTITNAMKENEKTGEEVRAAMLAARGDGLMAETLARRAGGAGWKTAVYVDGEGAAERLEEFFSAGGEVLIVALERGMKLGGDGEEALFLAMRAGLRIVPVGGEDAAAVWQAVIPPDMPELGGVEARRLDDGWESLLVGNGKEAARERKGGMDIWSGGPDEENPEVVLCEDDVLEEIGTVAAASPGRAEAGYAPAPGEGGASPEGRGKGAPLWVVSAGVCAAALAVAFFIPGIRGKSPIPVVEPAPVPVVKPAPDPVEDPAPALGREELLREARSMRKGKDPEKYERVMEELRRRGRAGDRPCQKAYETLKKRDGGSASVGSSAPAPVVKPAPASMVNHAPAHVEEPAPNLVENIAPAPVVKPAPAPEVKPAPAPVAKPAPAPVVKPTPSPVVKPAPSPVVKPAPTSVGGESFPEGWTNNQKELYNGLKKWDNKDLTNQKKVGSLRKNGLTKEQIEEVVNYILRERRKNPEAGPASS